MTRTTGKSGYISDIGFLGDLGYPVPGPGYPVHVNPPVSYPPNTLTGNENLVDGRFVPVTPVTATVVSPRLLTILALVALGYGAYKLYNKK
ncbi:MAG: hypothetical protein LAT57_00145 [Balneolales bacterium]|nr:hypothetical protein [Balneolales bacterium]